MATVAKLTNDGTLKLSGKVDTRLPLVTDGLIAYYPMDGTLNKTNCDLTKARVLGVKLNTAHSWWNWFNAQGNLTLETDILNVSVATALTYDLILVDAYVWAVSSSIISKLKEFVDAGVSCIATGNDTTSNIFVASKTGSEKGSHDIIVDEFNPVDTDLLTYTYGSTDLIGGISSLQNGAIPFYRRNDTNKITGYTYTSDSGASFYFDQEGLGATDLVKSGWQFVLNNSRGGITDIATTKTYDGIAIESATTNKVISPTNIINWSKTPAVDNGTHLRSYNEVLEDGQTHLNIHWGRVSGSGNAWANIASGYWNTPDIPMTMIFEYRINAAGGAHGLTFRFSAVTNDYWTSGRVSHNPSSSLVGKGWQKATLYRTFDATYYKDPTTYPLNGNFTIYSGGMANPGDFIDFDFRFPQVEEKPYTTEFVDGSRSSSTLELKIQPLQTLTIFGEFTPSTAFDGTYTTTPTQSSLIGFHDTISVGNIYYRYWVDGTPQSNSFLDADGSYGTTHSHKVYDILANEKLYYVMRKSGSTMRFEIYQDGWKGEHIDDIGNNPIDKISFGQTTPIWNGKHRNISIYNKELSDDEINKLIKGTHNITTDGLVTSSISTESNLGDYYFPLSLNGDDYYKSITPSEDNATYTDGDAYVIGSGGLEYNLNSSIGLDWSGDWSICYMKKPIGTHYGESNLTGYSIESLGCNGNSVGGGYFFWGKTNNSNSMHQVSGGGAFEPITYFQNWQYITMVKSGSTITINTWLNDSLIRVRTLSTTTTISNYYVTQYGYDLKIGGWDNNNNSWSHFKNLVVAKRAMTQTELDDYRLTKLKATEDGLILNNINTNVEI